MLLGVVSASDIIDVKLPRTVFVHDLVSFQREIFSEFVHLSSDHSEEFFVRDFTTAISVEQFEDFADLGFIQTDSEITHAFLELLFIKRVRSVIISNFEFPSN